MIPDTFSVAIEGVGTLTCRRRTMRTAVAMAAEYNRLTEGAEVVPPEFDGLCNFLAYLKVMVVDGPDGWDPYAVDPEDPDAMARLRLAYSGIQDAEGRFRSGAKPQPEGEGALA